MNLNTMYHIAVALLPVYPFVWAGAILLVKYLLGKMPLAQQKALESNALKVVQAVEQVGNGESGASKKRQGDGNTRSRLQGWGHHV